MRMTDLRCDAKLTKEEQISRAATTMQQLPNTIKERLNLHVKRRLQQEAELASTSSSAGKLSMNTAEQKEQPTSPAWKNRHSSNTASTSKQTKQRRPYRKRKIKLSTEEGDEKKTKREKRKWIGSTASVIPQRVAGAPLSADCNTPNKAYMGEDEGSQDGSPEKESKGSSGRDKDKCPDVLAAVLSVKKCAMMQNPEVQEFLKKVMGAIKS